ncbi:MAG: TolC family protein [Tannerella sp.]|jgi:outer membrane protein TolC|nr:TolC family protein [Tannerella sp.]
MKTSFKIIFSNLLLLKAVTLQAQTVYTLEQCREMALKNNRTSAIAGRMEDKTAYESKSYRANFLPKITATGGYMLTNNSFSKTIAGNYLPTFVPDLATGELKPNIVTMPDGTPMIAPDGNPVFKEYAYFPDMKIDMKLNGTYFAGLTAEQPIFMGGKITSAYRMSQIGREMSALNSAVTRAEVIVKTDESYWMHIKALETRKVATAFKQVIEELMRNVEAAVKAGMKTRNDLLKVQVQMNRADLQIQQSDNAIRLSHMNLCQVTGLPSDAEFGVREVQGVASSPTMPSLTMPSEIETINSRPEFSLLDRQVELKSQQIKLIRSDYLPNVGLTASYGYLHGPELNGSPLIDKASFSALFTVSIPVFHWGEGINKIRAARAEKHIAELQRDELKEKMQLEAKQYENKMQESDLELALTTRTLEQAAENMRIIKDSYDKGMETLSACLEAQTLWQQASLDHLNAQINKHLNQTYYLKATGRLN